MNRYQMTCFDGKVITVTEWKPEGEIKAILQISHGMVEHSLRYQALAERLVANGVLVFADDHRAHGESDKDNLGWSAGDIFENTLKDLSMLSEKYKTDYPNVKLVFFGHSYGSFLTQAYIQRYPKLYDAVIIGGSARMSGLTAFGGRAVASMGRAFKGERAVGKLMKKMTFDSYNKKFKEGNFVSSIPEEAARYLSDPYCNFVCSYNFYRSFMKGLSGLYRKKGLANIDKSKPILIISGKDDPVGGCGKDTTKLYELYKKIGIKDLKLVLLNGRHEYFNDVDSEKAFETFINFVREKGM